MKGRAAASLLTEDIDLTLGTQLPFDRLVKAMDEVAPSLQEAIFGQIGNARVKPANFESVDFLAPREFKQHFDAARVIVGHAGIGTILSGLKAEKPLVLMARRVAFGEHRNDHQLATVSQMNRIPGIHIAETREDLQALLSEPDLALMKAEESLSRQNLLTRLRAEIFS